MTASAEHAQDRRVVVGIDFGTLSGRAVVVRVADGAELGSAVTPYPTPSSTGCCRHRRRPAAGLGAAGPRRTTSTCCATPCPRALAAAGVDPADVIGVATDFTACTVLPVLGDGTPLCELPELAGPSARVRQAVEAPRRAGPGRPHQRARRSSAARPGCPATAAGSRRSGCSRRACSCSRRTRGVYARTAHFVEAADWIVWQLCRHLRPQRLHRRVQGVLQDGEYPSPRVPRPR